MTLPNKGQQVVLTQGIQFDILDDNHFIGGGGEEGIVDNFLDIQCVTLGQKLHGFCSPGRGIFQAMPVQVFANIGNNRSVSFL